jgi:hypothetical protein
MVVVKLKLIERSKILEPIHKSNTEAKKETNWTCKFTTYI